ncbi:TonB-dependent receptor domain-containing protein [Pseudokordiimonas caeni]|uniref:TonB-dependent receptor domain-containing protein n=1 Tax=Pseudokordiimonas caeni TaxID=2997908 RepID=UPI002812181E|nr:TonB-dependent receptor [Pseudokordiimonas caeni]
MSKELLNLRRAALLGSAATLLASSFTGVAVAQDQSGDDEFVIEEVIVTGSLIRNPNLVRSAPVAVVSTDEMTFQQTNVAEEILREIPGMVPSIGSNVNNGNGGFSYVNLRGIGSNRNIVLIDGQRLSPSELNGRFDLNNVPLALVERVDVLTGGASTTYGADALGGVVNFVTKRDFNGVEMNAAYGVTEEGDGDTKRFEVTMGADLGDGKGNAVVSIGYQDSKPVYQGDRAYSVCSLGSGNGLCGGSGLGPYNTRFGNVNPTGTDGGNLALGGVQDDRTFGAAFTPFNFNPFNVYQTPFERYNIYAAANYEIAEGVEVYTRGIFSRNVVETIIAPSGAFGDSVTVSLSHPYLSDAQRNAFCAFDTQAGDGYTPLFTQAECDAAATATSPNDPNYREVDTQLRRRNVEGGPRVSEYSADYFDYQLGFRGDITESISWDVYGSYGESRQSQLQQGYWLKSRFRQGLLAGPDGCFDSSNGCVPVDFFGPTGSINEEMTAFLQGGESTVVTKFDMAQVKGVVSGETGWTLPWASEAVNFAVGGEYRKYSGAQKSDLLSKGGDLGGAGGAAPDISGGYSVYEGVAEFVVPVVSDASWAKSLNFEAGIRYSDYSIDADTNPSFSTTTWKLGTSWTPVDDITFRATFARAVRAPNIAELFAPVTTNLTNLGDDPCASVDDNGQVVNSGPTGVVRDVCIAQGAPAGTIGAIPFPAAGQANYTGGGNINLTPEKSDSWTLGAIIQPAAVPGLTVTIDYYNIKVEEAIAQPTPNDALDACFDNPSTSNPACLAIVRSPIDGSLSGDEAVVKGLPLAFSNSGNLATDGIDVTVSYGHTFGAVDWNSTFAGNWTNSSTFEAVTGVSGARECVGLYSANCASIQPKFSWNWRNTFSVDKFDVSVMWRHIDGNSYEFEGDLFEGELPDNLGYANFNKIGSYDYFDLSVRYNVLENVSITGTVSNLFDKEPPIVGNDTGSTSYNSGNTYPSTYDALGRRYGISAKVTF